jgi:hypothetical protein
VGIFQIQQSFHSDQFVSPTTFNGCWSDEASDDGITTKVLTWSPPDDLLGVVSHFAVYRQPSERLVEGDDRASALPNERSHDEILEVPSTSLISSERATMSPCDSGIINADVFTSLDSSRSTSAVLCTACAPTQVDSRSEATRPISSSLPGVQASDVSVTGRWRCIGLTPANCFRITTPDDMWAEWAVLPVTFSNLVLSPVRIQAD